MFSSSGTMKTPTSVNKVRKICCQFCCHGEIGRILPKFYQEFTENLPKIYRKQGRKERIFLKEEEFFRDAKGMCFIDPSLKNTYHLYLVYNIKVQKI